VDKQLIVKLQHRFDRMSHVLDDSEIVFWYARDLMVELGYERWENFTKVVEKAVAACQGSNIAEENHFRGITKMVKIGSGAERRINDIILTRYACYLIAQNGDPRKQQIAFAQTYFALQTRKQELIEERIRLQERMLARNQLRKSETEFSRNIYQRGIDDKGFGRIRSKGDTALFGGKNTKEMKSQLGVPQNRPLADFLPMVTIAAKNLATEITNHNVNENDLSGETSITNEHVQNNKSVRNLLGERGIKPEMLEVEEDLKKLERCVKTSEKKLIKSSVLPNIGEKG